MAKEKEALFRVETNILPTSKLVVVFAALSFVLLIAFIDQNSLGVALPTIGADLNCATTIAWAGTSTLIANTVFQVLYGRLSDIFGRKVIFLAGVGCLALGDLLCSFARSGPQLYGFRAIAGIGQGCITALTMMIVSDVVTLENRGKYQGILGSMVGVGNAVGPFLGAAFVQKSTWRGLFWLISPVAVIGGVLVFFIIPASKTVGDPKEKVRSIDWIGLAFSTTAILLLLIPISGGGTYFTWSSAMVISMLTIGSISAVLFVIAQWRWSSYPMMPLRLFQNRPVTAILIQNFLFGIVYYSQLYYLPVYYQIARGYSPIESAILTLPFVAAQATISILSGQYISRMKRYGEVIWVGYTLWTLGTGLILLFDRSISPWKIVIILLVEGAGVGNVFQPTLIAAQAHCTKADRAVVISVRNLLRSLGGAVGLALSSAIFSNVLSRNLNTLTTPLPAGAIDAILTSVLSVPNTAGLNAVQANEILDSYMSASRAVFIIWVPLIGVCLLLCFFIKDRGLIRPGEERPGEAAVTQDEVTSSVEVPGDTELGKVEK